MDEVSISYPYILENIIFSQIHIERLPELPENMNIPTEFKFKIENRKGDPNGIQAHILLESPEDAPVKFKVEAIGLFTCVESSQSSENVKMEYLSQRGLFIVWAYLDQLMRTITMQMGMSPLNIPKPREITLEAPYQG